MGSRCRLCGRRIWLGGADYCRRCLRTAPRCDVCGAPMGEARVRLPDGRGVCADCHATAVYDAAQAQAIFARVVGAATEALGLRLNVGAEFTLADGQHLARLATEAEFDPPPDGRIVGLFVRRGHQRVMYVLLGLPQLLLTQTIAHEWAHAWQGENCPLLKSPLLREGFAEWVAYKTLQALGAVKRTAQMERQNGLYGAGLRKMIELERREGVEGVLDFCRRGGVR